MVEAGCVFLADHLEEWLTYDDAELSRQEILGLLRDRLDEVAAHLGCRQADLACTFLAVAATEERFVVVHVGDGVIGYVRDAALSVISEPDNVEFANQTTFVTSPDASVSTRLYRGSLEGITGFILMSDGTSASLFDYRNRQLAPACEKLISIVADAPTRQSRNPEHKKRLRRLIDMRVRAATKDDCSIGILGLRR